LQAISAINFKKKSNKRDYVTSFLFFGSRNLPPLLPHKSIAGNQLSIKNSNYSGLEKGLVAVRDVPNFSDGAFSLCFYPPGLSIETKSGFVLFASFCLFSVMRPSRVPVRR
jgi:hypothetical protein